VPTQQSNNTEMRPATSVRMGCEPNYLSGPEVWREHAQVT
jgi:hypothetical protein